MTKTLQHKILTRLIFLLPEKTLIRRMLRGIFLESVISSRVVEYPFIFNSLDLPKGAKVLDVGCCYSLLSIQLASLGYDVYGIDVEEYPYTHPNFRFIKADIRKTNFPDGYFDCVVAVSTIEHVGIPFSFSKLKVLKKICDMNGDVKAMNEIRRILKINGILLITLPFGRTFLKTNTHRIYDKRRLNELLNDFELIKAEYYVNKNDCWMLAPSTEVECINQVDDKVKAIVCFKARKSSYL